MITASTPEKTFHFRNCPHPVTTKYYMIPNTWFWCKKCGGYRQVIGNLHPEEEEEEVNR
jgi:hypothetical protein